MSFPVETTDGETVLIESKEIGADGDVLLTAEDGRTFKRSSDALRVELAEAGAAVGHLADEASEAIDEVVEDIKDAASAVAEDVDDLIDAAEAASKEVGDVIEAAGDVAEDIAADPLGTLKDIVDGEDEATA